MWRVDMERRVDGTARLVGISVAGDERKDLRRTGWQTRGKYCFGPFSSSARGFAHRTPKMGTTHEHVLWASLHVLDAFVLCIVSCLPGPRPTRRSSANLCCAHRDSYQPLVTEKSPCRVLYLQKSKPRSPGSAYCAVEKHPRLAIAERSSGTDFWMASWP